MSGWLDAGPWWLDIGLGWSDTGPKYSYVGDKRALIQVSGCSDVGHSMLDTVMQVHDVRFCTEKLNLIFLETKFWSRPYVEPCLSAFLSACPTTRPPADLSAHLPKCLHVCLPVKCQYACLLAHAETHSAGGRGDWLLFVRAFVFEGGLPLKVVFHWRLSSIEGLPPLKGFLHWR